MPCQLNSGGEGIRSRYRGALARLAMDGLDDPRTVGPMFSRHGISGRGDRVDDGLGLVVNGHSDLPIGKGALQLRLGIWRTSVRRLS